MNNYFALLGDQGDNKLLDLNDPNLFREKCYINGEWLDADTGQTVDVTNPATGDVLGVVPKMGAIFVEDGRIDKHPRVLIPIRLEKRATEQCNAVGI